VVLDLDPQSVKYGFDALRSALETLKSFKESLGYSKDSDELNAKLSAADKQIKFAEAQLAQALGYELCRAHFPPVPMLLNRVDEKRIVRVYRCPECGRDEPPPEYFAAEANKDSALAMAREKRRRQSGL
jgi:hypothetical protein